MMEIYTRKQLKLWEAVKENDVAGIKSALKSGWFSAPADINMCNNNWETALWMAVNNRNFDAFWTLLDNGANPYFVNKWGYSILDNCVSTRDTDVVRRLCSVLDINKVHCPGESLNQAIYDDNYEMTEILLDFGVSPNEENEDGYTPVTTAVGQGNLNILELLAKRGADFQQADEDGASLLTSVLVHEDHRTQVQLARFLIENGTDVNCVNKSRGTALMDAAYENNVDLVELYLQNGANANIQDRYGYTALMYAVKHNNVESVEALLKAGVNVNTKRKKGDTALTIAEKMYYQTRRKKERVAYARIIQLLIENGAENDIPSAQSLIDNAGRMKPLKITSLKNTVRKKNGNELSQIAQENQNFLKRLVQTGLILEALQKMTYEQTSELYKKTEKTMSLEVRKKAQDIVRNKR